MRFLGVFKMAIEQSQSACDEKNDPENFCDAHTPSHGWCREPAIYASRQNESVTLTRTLRSGMAPNETPVRAKRQRRAEKIQRPTRVLRMANNCARIASANRDFALRFPM